jgi:hypothetical protein
MELFRITKSKLREELLTLYFTNPDKKYYLRVLERMLHFSVGNIRRELIKLERTGLFRIENKGNMVYYYLNQSYPLNASRVPLNALQFSKNLCSRKRVMAVTTPVFSLFLHPQNHETLINSHFQILEG